MAEGQGSGKGAHLWGRDGVMKGSGGQGGWCAEDLNGKHLKARLLTLERGHLCVSIYQPPFSLVCLPVDINLGKGGRKLLQTM